MKFAEALIVTDEGGLVKQKMRFDGSPAGIAPRFVAYNPVNENGKALQKDARTQQYSRKAICEQVSEGRWRLRCPRFRPVDPVEGSCGNAIARDFNHAGVVPGASIWLGLRRSFAD